MERPTEEQATTHRIVSVRAPAQPIFRIARLGADPFEPPPWEYAGGNRFDDPQREFRVIYCASQRAAAFGETLARFRRSLSLLALMNDVEDDEPTEQALSGLLDPNDERRGVIPFDWRFKRQIGSTLLDPSLKFAAIAEPESIAHLRVALAPQLTMLALSGASIDFDLGTIFTDNRRISQLCARYLYELRDEHGRPRFAGIRYTSRINLHWTCWAIFDGRLIHTSLPPETTIDLRDPGFIEAARLLDLSVEVVRGHGAYWHP